MKKALFLLPFALIGCNNNSERMPLFGKWDIEFIPTKAESKRFTLSGYLMLYRNKDSFLLSIEGEQQGIEATGNWKLEKGRVTLSATDIKIDDHGGESVRDPNLVYINNDAVRNTLSKPIILRVSEDKKSLKGLLISFSDLQGDFRGKRP